MDVFAYDRALVTDELARLRYEASMRPGFQESFGGDVSAPRQRWVDAMASPEAAIRALPHETLLIHGREDRVIPLANSLTLAQWISRAQLHVYRPLRPLDADRARGAVSRGWWATSWQRPTPPSHKPLNGKSKHHDIRTLIHQLGDELYEALRGRRVGGAAHRRATPASPSTTPTAYQQRLIARRTEAGERVVGKKIGVTSQGGA